MPPVDSLSHLGEKIAGGISFSEISEMLLSYVTDLDCFDDLTLMRVTIRKHVDDGQSIESYLIAFVEAGVLLNGRVRQKTFFGKLRVI